MHKRLLMVLGFTGIFCFAQACTQIQTFPQTENPEIDTNEEFEKLVTDVQDLKGETIKLAGQVRRVEENDEGLLVIADWLPYPQDDLHFTEDSHSPKSSSKKVGGHRFTFLYPGAKNVDPAITWKGNKFIILGDITGKKDIPTSLTGRSTSVLYLVAQCVRVWKTGGSRIGQAPDSQLGAYPPLARTYCAK